MLLLTCPCCGAVAEETEFHAGGQAHIERKAGPEHSEADFEEYLFLRNNPKGVHLERWRHQFGCGKWFNLVRDTRTLEIYGTYDIAAKAPPKEIMDHVAQRLAALGLPEKTAV